MSLYDSTIAPSRRSFILGASAAAAASALPLSTSGMQEPEATISLRAQKLAWAGVRLQLGKATLVLDPLINPDVWDKSLKDPLIIPELPEGERYVLVTHRHEDHFDPLAIRKIVGEKGLVVCDANVAPLAARAGFRVFAASLYEPVLLGDFTVASVPAQDGYGDPQVSWVVTAGGKRIVHCGDTLWHGSWWRIGRQFGPFDVGFLPINGARFEWKQPVSDIPAVLTPDQAVAAAVVMGVRRIVPIHYGVSGAEGYREMPDLEASLVKAAKARNVEVEIVRPGQWVTWG